MKPHYTVIWSKSARQKLAEIWLRASDKKALSRVVDGFDAALRSKPEAQLVVLGAPVFENCPRRGESSWHATFSCDSCYREAR